MTTVLDGPTVDSALEARGIAWSREGDELVREVKSSKFVGALAFVNAVGALAELADHHPDIAVPRQGAIAGALIAAWAAGKLLDPDAWK